MISGLLADGLADADVERLERVWGATDTNFVKLAELAGLDRSSAWRYLNLSGTDFTDCDLRGFDFTGADLSGCTGSNVIVDATTILDGAELDASIFELGAAAARIFEVHPELQREYRRIKGSYWTEQHNWVCDILSRKLAHPEARRTLALALYFDTKDGFVRRTILSWMVYRSGDFNEALGFLVRFLSEPGQDDEAIASAIIFLGSRYRRNEHAASLLFSIAEDPKRSLLIRTAAATAVLGNETTIRNLSRASALARDLESRTLDNMYIRMIAKQISQFHLLVVGEGKPRGGINFQDPIDEPALFRIVSGVWSARKEDEPRRVTTAFDAATLAELVPLVADCLRDLRNRGLRIRIEFDDTIVEAVVRQASPAARRKS